MQDYFIRASETRQGGGKINNLKKSPPPCKIKPMKDPSFLNKLKNLPAQWPLPLSRSERAEFDRENTDINCRRIFIYSLFSIVISAVIFMIIYFVFRHRLVYTERELYFSGIELFHKVHIALSMTFVAAYLAIKRLGANHASMKFAQNAAIITIALMYVYLCTITHHYHGDLVFYAVICIIIAVALYLGKAARTVLYLSMSALMIIGLLSVVGDIDLRIMKITNVIIISVIGYILSSVIYRFRLKDYLHMNDLTKMNLQLLHDLAGARSMQNRLIPSAPPVTDGASIYTLYRPIEMVGGDFFDFIPLRKDATGIFISDVSGHGVTASLITGMIKTLIDTADETRKSPGTLLDYINSRSNGLMAGNFLTAVYGIVDTAGMTFTYSRGGHTLPLLLKNGGIEELHSRGTFIGVYKDLTFEEKSVTLNRGDRILLYTDGLIEATNARGTSFQDVFMHDVLPGIVSNDTDDFVRHIYRELVSFTGGETFNDDICMVGIKVARNDLGG